MNVKKIHLYFFVCCFFAFASDSCLAQEWKKLKSVPLLSPVLTVSLDRYGLFYIADEDGNIFKYDTLGVLQTTYSPSRKADVTLIDAWRNVNIFVFYRSLQEYILLDRFLSPSPNSRIESTEIGFARLASYSSDNNIWIIDETDFSLKKYDIARNKVALNTSLDLLLDPALYDLNSLREYQNLIFVSDRNSGVLIFDNMGNYKTKIVQKEISRLGFYNDEIYFQEGGAVKFINIYTYVERFEKLPESSGFQFVLYTKSYLYLVRELSVEVYRR